MDWRERAYYWVRLNNSGTAWFEKGHDHYGKEYERRVKELRKIPGLKMLPLPSMALAREEREKVPEWAQVLVSCRKVHLSTLRNTFIRFGSESYGCFDWERVMEPKKGEKRKMEAGAKIEAGDLVRVMDGSGIKDYCGGWTPQMDMFVGRILEVNRVVNELGWKGRGVKLEYGGGYTWDTRGLELVEKGKVQPEPETKAEKAEAKEFKIRNSAGVLTVRAERELSLRDVFHGMGDDKLPEMKRPRLELHKGEHYNDWLVTLSDRDCEGTMYVLEFSDFGDGVKAYLGEYDVEVPDRSYVTTEEWKK